MNKIFFSSLFICLYVPFVFATSEFLDFEYGDSPEEIQNKAENICKVQPLQQNKRWYWRSVLSCKELNYKGVNTIVYFQFFQKKLKRISVVSTEILNYFLFRDPKNRYLLSKEKKVLNKTNNLIDKLIFEDKVHYQQKGNKLTYFFYKGKWEWELLYEEKGYQKLEAKAMSKQLKKEEERGAAGWKNYKFNLSEQTVRAQLEGLCASLLIDEKAVFQGVKVLTCNGYSFLDQKISIGFKFFNEKLASINLHLPKSYYSTLRPLLIKKYSTPYIEYTEDLNSYPYIVFPADSIELRYLKKARNKVYLSLKYIRKGYLDPIEIKSFKEKSNKKILKKIKSKSDVIMDNI